MEDNNMTECTLIEKWRPIQGPEGYEVSGKGQVRSLDRVVAYKKNGKIVTYKKKGLILKPETDRGYKKVMLGRGNRRYVHELVCTAFEGEKPSPKHETRHLNGVRGANRSENLVWGTRQENAADRARHGTQPYGENSPVAKLTEVQARLVDMLGRKHPHRMVAKAFEITQSNVSAIVTRRSWPKLTRIGDLK